MLDTNSPNLKTKVLLNTIYNLKLALKEQKAKNKDLSTKLKELNQTQTTKPYDQDQNSYASKSNP